MKNIDVVVVTEDRYLNPTEINDYNKNVLLEDRLVIEALEKQGLKADRKSWSDTSFNWSSTKYILFRSTWDYFDRYSEFENWLGKVTSETILLNSANTIQWNIDKHYLLDLQEKGIPVCETHFIEKGTITSLLELHQKLGWKKTVLKPCISGAARHTYKLDLNNLDKHENIFQKLIANEAMMLQPFQENIVTKGEYSFMVMNGKYTHAVLKIAKPGDFRVQDDFGGSVHIHEATPEEKTFAEKAVLACPELPMYARVDVIIDNNNNLAISEVELIEPELWFRNHHEAATVLAKGIKKLIA
ncbi:ATP-grasp domain-containing protein [Pseudofulvibacter geojedonensis]|uniref:RimK family alpha-L-glutamate ligase n=1 Tax=Pseudofulvibacter geojedonensis TaxID=1123758 RepID=A0ABW3I2N2_9FLAO